MAVVETEFGKDDEEENKAEESLIFGNKYIKSGLTSSNLPGEIELNCWSKQTITLSVIFNYKWSVIIVHYCENLQVTSFIHGSLTAYKYV